MSDLFSAPSDGNASPVPNRDGGDGGGGKGVVGVGVGGENFKPDVDGSERTGSAGAQCIAEAETTDDQAFLIKDAQVCMNPDQFF